MGILSLQRYRVRARFHGRRFPDPLSQRPRRGYTPETCVKGETRVTHEKSEQRAAAGARFTGRPTPRDHRARLESKSDIPDRLRAGVRVCHRDVRHLFRGLLECLDSSLRHPHIDRRGDERGHRHPHLL